MRVSSYTALLLKCYLFLPQLVDPSFARIAAPQMPNITTSLKCWELPLRDIVTSHACVPGDENTKMESINFFCGKRHVNGDLGSRQRLIMLRYLLQF